MPITPESEYNWSPGDFRITLPEFVLLLQGTESAGLGNYFEGQIPTVGDIVSLVCYRDETVNGKQSLYFKLKVTGRVEN